MRTQHKHLIKLFETCYADGDKEIVMLGVPKYIQEAYRQYYADREANG